MKWDEETKQYVAETFNFYISPHSKYQDSTFVSDVRQVLFLMNYSNQTGTFKFLRDNHFDFNKWLDHSIVSFDNNFFGMFIQSYSRI